MKPDSGDDDGRGDSSQAIALPSLPPLPSGSGKPGSRKKKPVETYQITTYNAESSAGSESGSTTTTASSTTCANAGRADSTRPVQRLFKKHSKDVVFYSDATLVTTMERTYNVLGEAQTMLSECLDKNAEMTGQKQPFRPVQAIKEGEILEAGLTDEKQCISVGASIDPADATQPFSMPLYDMGLLDGQRKLHRSFQISKPLLATVNARLNEAMRLARPYVNLYAFALVDGCHYYCHSESKEVVKGQVAPRPYAYELVKNEYEPGHVDEDQLLNEMVHFTEQYKKVSSVLNFLRGDGKATTTVYHYQIYKRRIDYYGDAVADSKLSGWFKLTNSKKTGYYYAIIVNFAMTEPRDRLPDEIHIKLHSNASSSSSSALNLASGL